MRVSSLERALPEIIAQFEASDHRVFSEGELAGILLQNRDRWSLAERITLSHFIQFLLENTSLRTARVTSAIYPSILRYIWGQYSPYQLGASLKTRGYLSHASAVFLHGLTDELPTSIYVNLEQSPKPAPQLPLSQDSINRAFARNARRSRYILEFEQWRFVLVSGKSTGNLGVEQLKGPLGELIPSTGLPRTLIDIAVRPEYGGGVYQVLDAYRGSLKRTSVASLLEPLVSTLRSLDYVYPFHQVIGFYMTRAGYPAWATARLHEFGMKFDFFLAHGIREKAYDAEWRLFFPKDFELTRPREHEVEVGIE